MATIPRRPLGAAFATAFLWAACGLAQDPSKPKDDALDSLLETLEKPETPGTPGQPPPPRPTEGDSPTTPRPEANDLPPQDKALDGLLEKLGETRETPAPDDRKPMPGAEGHNPPPDPTKVPPPGSLKGKEKDLDEHLEELTGRKKKKKGKDDEAGSGPLSEVIKEMRDVEKRLGKPDTGEETRKRQGQIVKNLDTLIEQLRASSSQSRSRKRFLAMKPGSQPGSQLGQPNAGSMGGKPPASRPSTPQANRSLAGGKDEWGHLPPELRQEMENVFKEEALPLRSELIRRYYLSLSKKTRAREERP